MKVSMTETERSSKERAVVQAKRGGREGVDGRVELSTRRGVRGEEQRRPNVASPEVRASENATAVPVREVGRGDVETRLHAAAR